MLFDNLFEKASNTDSLDLFIKNNIEQIDSFAKQLYNEISEHQDSIEKFIFLKYQAIECLNFNQSYNKAFISILIEICERLGSSACLLRLYSIFIDNKIYLGERLNAVLLYLYNVQDRNQYIDRFDEICLKLTYSSENEEDNINKPVASFLNYFAYVLYNTQPHKEFSERLRQKINEAVEKNKYSLLKHESISQLLAFSFENVEFYFKEIQDLIDKLLNKVSIIELHFDPRNLLIEENTPYSILFNKTKVSFESIRQTAINNTDGQANTDRGAAILTSEQQLYTYLYRFGNMHKAKLDSAFEYIPSHIFSEKIDIIDWGCGQGLATISYFDRFATKNINSCILIEPSELAIKRAAFYIKKYNEDIKIKTICKKLDSLLYDDFPPQKHKCIHFFSNILDIDDYNQAQLFELIRNTQNCKIWSHPDTHSGNIRTVILETSGQPFWKHPDSDSGIIRT